MVAGEFAQQVFVGGVHRDLRAAGQNFCGGTVDVLALHQHGHGNTAPIQGAMDDLGAFGDKQTLGRLKTVQELSFCQPGIDIQFRSRKIGDFNDIWHKHYLKTDFSYSNKRREKSQNIPGKSTFFSEMDKMRKTEWTVCGIMPSQGKKTTGSKSEKP